MHIHNLLTVRREFSKALEHYHVCFIMDELLLIPYNIHNEQVYGQILRQPGARYCISKVRAVQYNTVVEPIKELLAVFEDVLHILELI